MAILQNKMFILVLGSVLAAAIAWYIFLRTPTEQPLLQTDNLTTSTSEADKDVVQTLLQLRAITLSGTIFTDPAFLSLRDTGTQIIPEPVGRSNPFVSISVSLGTSTAPNISSSTSTSTSTPASKSTPQGR